ncbi:MAG: hypothetical protein [Microviridae sp.]|nr:MAG: hypothetical protein [Microviridae sp.]
MNRKYYSNQKNNDMKKLTIKFELGPPRDKEEENLYDAITLVIGLQLEGLTKKQITHHFMKLGWCEKHSKEIIKTAHFALTSGAVKIHSYDTQAEKKYHEENVN